MAVTRQQILEVGFKPTKRQKGLGTRQYDTLMYKINDEDYLYLGYNDFRGNIDFKILWKSINTELGRISYPIQSIGNLTLTSLKEYIKKAELAAELKDKLKMEHAECTVIEWKD